MICHCRYQQTHHHYAAATAAADITIDDDGLIKSVPQSPDGFRPNRIPQLASLLFVILPVSYGVFLYQFPTQCNAPSPHNLPLRSVVALGPGISDPRRGSSIIPTLHYLERIFAERKNVRGKGNRPRDEHS